MRLEGWRPKREESWWGRGYGRRAHEVHLLNHQHSHKKHLKSINKKHKRTLSNSLNVYELRVFRFTWLKSTTYRLRLALLWMYSTPQPESRQEIIWAQGAWNPNHNSHTILHGDLAQCPLPHTIACFSQFALHLADSPSESLSNSSVFSTFPHFLPLEYITSYATRKKIVSSQQWFAHTCALWTRTSIGGGRSAAFKVLFFLLPHLLPLSMGIVWLHRPEM